jgi:hypothetical protein
LAAGALALAAVLNLHEPLEGWLVWRYARALGLALVFTTACFAAGHALMTRLIRERWPLSEHLALALPLGLVAYFFVAFAFGLAGLFGTPLFVGAPVLLLAVGARDLTRTATRFRRHAARLELRPKLGPLDAIVLAGGCLGVFYLWFTILTPLNASYDARWYHLPLAERMVATGGVRAFSEGWIFGAFPQLASVVYAWAFSAPGTTFDHVETAAHLEWAIFLMTLVGVSALVRRMIGRRSPLAWAAVFLFPGIFCYDSGLVLGADHVAAVFAAPVLLATLRYVEAPSHRRALLLSALVAGALDTKYSAVILLPLPLVAVLATTLRNWRRQARSPGAPPWLSCCWLVAFTAPHWLKNWVFYADPLYPLLRRWLPARPWQHAAEAPYATWLTLHHPPFAAASFVEMLKTLVTFSFVPHDFPVFHRDWPVFGSLFTLLTPLVPLVAPRRPLKLAMLGAYLGLAAWFWLHEFDRYLVVLVPWMAATVAAVSALVWREARRARIMLAGLIGLEVTWGAAVPFIPSHRAAAAAIPRVVVDLLAHGYTTDATEPLRAYPEWESVARALPPAAKVLVHEERISAGLERASVQDFPGDQGALYWGAPGATTPLEVWRTLQAHGVTHLLWTERADRGFDTVAGGLVFFDFVTHHAKRLGSSDGLAFAKLGNVPPPPSEPGEVAYYPCPDDDEPQARASTWDPVWAPGAIPGASFAPGLYPLGALARTDGKAIPALGVTRAAALERARFALYDARCQGPFPPEARARFELIASRGQAMLFERKD